MAKDPSSQQKNRTQQQALISARILLGIEQEVQHVAVFDGIGFAF